MDFNASNLQLVGGRFTGDPTPYLAALTADTMLYCVAETVRNGAVIKAWSAFEAPSDEITRLHVFGSGGDFNLRRDEDRYFWRYVGCARLEFPGGADYWAAHPNVTTLRLPEQTPHKALLWGKHSETEPGRWYEDRVGHARLHYPVEGTPERVGVCAFHLETLATETTTPEIVAYWTTAILPADDLKSESVILPCQTS